MSDHDNQCEVMLRPYDAPPICHCWHRAEIERLRGDAACLRGGIELALDYLNGESEVTDVSLRVVLRELLTVQPPDVRPGHDGPPCQFCGGKLNSEGHRDWCPATHTGKTATRLVLRPARPRAKRKQRRNSVTDKPKNFITTYQSIGGWKAVMYWWNPDMGGFWEPWETGFGRYKAEEKAIEEAQSWAEAEGLEYVPRVKPAA